MLYHDSLRKEGGGGFFLLSVFHSLVPFSYLWTQFIFNHIVKQLISLEATNDTTQKLMEGYMFLMKGYSAIPLDFPGTTYHRVLKVINNVYTVAICGSNLMKSAVYWLK